MKKAIPYYQRLLLAAFFSIAVVAMHSHILYVYGPTLTSDSMCFIIYGRILIDFNAFMPLYLRTPPYLLINGLTQSHLSLYPTLYVHIAVAGAAVGLLVFALSKHSRLCAFIVGSMLSVDMVWASSQRALMIEGSLSSFLLLALAALVWLFIERDTVSWFGCVAVGVLVAWSLVYRQSNLLLLIPIIIGMLWATRKIRITAFFTCGALIMIAALVALNAWRTGEPRLWSQGGWYFSHPMFQYKMFSPNNGPASARIYAHLKKCDVPGPIEDIRWVNPVFSYNKYEFDTCLKHQETISLYHESPELLNSLISDKSAQCLATLPNNALDGQVLQCMASELIEKSEWEKDWYKAQLKYYEFNVQWKLDNHVAKMLQKSYLSEAIPKNWHRLLPLAFNEVCNFLNAETWRLAKQYWLQDLSAPVRKIHCHFAACDDKYFHSVDINTSFILKNLVEFNTVMMQPYRYIPYLFLGHFLGQGVVWVWLVFSILPIVVLRGAPRFTSFAVFIFILYILVINSITNIIILRYTSPFSVFYSLQTAFFICAIFAILHKFGLGILNLVQILNPNHKSSDVDK